MQYSRASFPVDVLLERIEIEQCEHFTTSVIRPKRSDHFFLYRASITAKKKNTIWFHIIEKEIL